MGRALLFLCLALLVACAEEKTLNQYLAQSRTAIAEGDFPTALSGLRNAMNINAGSAEARFLLGKIHLEMERNAEAEKELRRAEDLGWPVDETRPRIARALFGQARFEEALALSPEGLSTLPTARMLAIQVLAALVLGEFDMAQALYDGATSLAPDDIEIRLLGARMDALQGRREAGLAEVEQVLDETPGYVEALRLRAHILLELQRLEEAREAFTATINRAGIDFSDRVARATINIRLDRLDEVEPDLKALRASAPNHPSTHYIEGLMAFHAGNIRDAAHNLGAARLMQGKYPLMVYFESLARLLEGAVQPAEDIAREFVQLVPDSVRGRRLLGALLLHNGKYDEVEEVLQPLRDFNPDDIYAINLVAHALLKKDRADQAMYLFRWLRRLRPDIPAGQIPLGDGLIVTALGAGNEEAIEAALAGFDPFPRDDILTIIGHLEKEDYAAALTAADSLKWRDTSGIAPYNVLAAVHLAAGQEAEAKEVLELALKRDPGNPPANLTLASLARRDGDYATEKQHYRAVLTYNPDHVPALMSLAVWEGRDGDSERMRAGLRQTVDFNPHLLEPRLALARFYLDDGDPQRVAPLFSDLLPLQQRSPRLLDLFARAEIAQGNHESAYAALTQLTRTVRGNAEQFQLLAVVADALGKRAEATAALEQALALNPNYVPALLAMARRAELAGDGPRLAELVEQLVALAPDEPEVMRIQSVLAARTGDTGKALQLAKDAHAAGRTSATLLQLTEMQRRSGRAQQARSLRRNWLKAHPRDVAVRLALSDQLYAENDLRAAELQYTQVLAQDPDNVLALNNLAWLLRHEDAKRSLAYIRRAANLMPNDPMVLDSRAVIEFLNGKHRAAAVVIQQALQVAPDNPSIRYHQAMIQNALGREDVARAQLEDILKDGSPAFPERAQAQALLQSLSAG